MQGRVEVEREMVGGVAAGGMADEDRVVEDEDGKAGTPVLLGETLSLGIAVWLGLGVGMES